MDNASFEDILTTLDYDRGIKVGTEGGSGFFYCGIAGDMLDGIDAYNARVYGYVTQSVTNAGKSLESTLAHCPTLQDFARKELQEKHPDLSIEHWNKAVAAWLKRVTSSKNRKDFLEEYFKNYENIKKRKVTDMRGALDVVDPDTTIIIIEGIERGKYWMISEAVEADTPIGFPDILEDSDEQ